MEDRYVPWWHSHVDWSHAAPANEAAPAPEVPTDGNN